ncbi:hypothetical protein [Nocardia blacklockiae]|uniref:hypothetical protein n=1 Tax=Nocardia blacklockiae TaxID=480036 RepID=UPI001E586DDB|nr:hypothetical protein [Nocardia blacklockiae]
MKSSDAEDANTDEAPTPTVDDEMLRSAQAIAAEIAAVGPPGWQSLAAGFALTVAAEAVDIVFTVDGRSVRMDPPEAILTSARRLRELSARLEYGPWWRLLVWSSEAGEPEFGYDYGDEPFPEGQLFAPEVYRADLEAFPRERLPVWLAAYIGHGDRQTRSPRSAVLAVRADRAAGVRAETMENQLPDLPVMWARWAVLSAAFVAVGSALGPRMLPSLGWFESSRRAGSTLYVLPGGRAVLSGGVWNAPELDAVYNEGAPMPNHYAGAPEWVADPVLNPRAATGMLSFCYWWDEGRWCRGESPSADRCGTAVPGVWTADTVVDVVLGLLPDRDDEGRRAAAEALVSAAQAGIVTRAAVSAVFGEDDVDIEAALYQFSIAGVTAREVPQAVSASEAVDRVRTYILDRGLDTTGYPLDRLTADRVDVGWMVYVPVPRGEIAIGRAIFYVADDGVVEHSTSSVAPSVYVAGFEERYRRRQGALT